MRGSVVLPCRLTGVLNRPSALSEAMRLMRGIGWHTPEQALMDVPRMTLHVPVPK